MKNILYTLLLPAILVGSCSPKIAQQSSAKQPFGNPIFTGWYADPEAAIFNKQYWIYPTYSAKYNQQVFMDAFSSKDLVNWTKHERIIDTAAIKWATRALWVPAIVKKNDSTFYFLALTTFKTKIRRVALA